MKTYSVYILTNRSGSVLYVGFTGDLRKRIWQHRTGVFQGFTSKYNATKLIYVEQTSDVDAAIRREKEIKGWRRSKKIDLIRTSNPAWSELAPDL